MVQRAGSMYNERLTSWRTFGRRRARRQPRSYCAERQRRVIPTGCAMEIPRCLPPGVATPSGINGSTCLLDAILAEAVVLRTVLPHAMFPEMLSAWPQSILRMVNNERSRQCYIHTCPCCGPQCPTNRPQRGYMLNYADGKSGVVISNTEIGHEDASTHC